MSGGNINLDTDPLFANAERVLFPGNSASRQEQSSWLGRICPLLSFSYFFCYFRFYKSYFDLTTREAYTRVLAAIFPFSGSFVPMIQSKADLYIPFWTYISMSFTIAIVSNALKYFNDGDQYYGFGFSLFFSTCSFVYII